MYKIRHSDLNRQYGFFVSIYKDQIHIFEVSCISSFAYLHLKSSKILDMLIKEYLLSYLTSDI